MSGFFLCAGDAVRAVSASAGVDSIGNLLTPDPKEAWVGATGVNAVVVDLGVRQAWDTVFLGFTTAAAGSTWALRYGDAAGGSATTVFAARPVVEPRTVPGVAVARSVHLYARLDAPVASRFVRIEIDGGAAAAAAGALVVGAGFTPAWSHELGGGRGIVDTGSRERLVGGGFGISQGARKGLVQWTFGDLSDDERDALYAFALSVGETRPLVAAEGAQDGPGLQARLTYGVFDRLESYERRDVGKTRWSFRMEDWR